MLYVQEIVRGDTTPGVCMFLVQSVLKPALLSPHLLSPALAPAAALTEQSSHH